MQQAWMAAVLLAVSAVHGRAQSVPVPFAGTLAGGGTVCSGSIPVFAVGKTGATYGDGCPATQATLNVPVAVATDTYGDVFIGDQTYQLVRVVYNGSPALAAAIIASNVQTTGLTPVKGNIYTIAGGVTATPTGSPRYCNQAGSGPIGTDTSFDGCPGVESEQGPRGLAVDADGNLFIASVSPDSQIRVLYVGGAKAAALITLENPTITSPQVGYVYNVAGGNSSAYTGDGALATKASLNTPRGIYIDANENIYFADEFNNAIRFVSSTTGFISTLAGHNAGSVSSCSGVSPAGDGSSATATTASLACPYGAWLDANGNIFIAEAGSGSTTVPGRVRVVYEGGTLPGISSPVVGNIYTYAGAAPVSGGTATTGAQQTTFQEVFGVALDAAGYLYVTDYRTGSTGSNKIWRVDPTNGNIAAIAGNGASALTSGAHCNGGTTGPTATNTRGDGCPATQAYLNTPQESLGFDGHGNFYVADRSNNVVRSFTYDNSFAATAVGSSMTQPVAFLYAAGSLPVTETFASSDYSDAGGDTCALNVSLSATTTCVVYVKFVPVAAGQRAGAVTVASATATIGAQTLNGVGTAPVLTIAPPTAVTIGSGLQPVAVSVDAAGNVNVSDAKSKSVVRGTIAGGATTSYITGLGAPAQTATDGYGDVFVVDSTNNNVIEKTAAGATVTLGSGLSSPQGLAVDVFGNVFVADTGNNRLVEISAITGAQKTVTLSGFTLSGPSSLAVDATGDLYVIDTNNTRVVEIPLGATPIALTLPTGATPVAMGFDAGGDLYLADKASASILFVPAGSTTATTFVGGLKTPAGVAVGATGNVFVADSAASAVSGYNVALNNSTFATTNVSLTSLPITLTVGNVGNTTATLSTPVYTESGTNASAFIANGTPTCTGGGTLATGASCTQAFAFAPTTATVTQTAKATFSDTAGQTVTANFSATATNLVLTTTTISPSGASIHYGQTQSYSTTMTPNTTTTPAPTGTMAFLVGGTTQSSQTLAASPYTFTFTASPGVGTYSVAANYSGDATYASSNAATTLTVTKATTSITASSAQTASGTQLSATMTPGSTGAVTFTGNVVFYVDNAVVATVPVGSGKVSATVLVADGSHTYYATYVGDSNYATSTSTTQTLSVARTATTITLTSTPVSTNGVGGLMLSAKVSTTGTGTPSGTVTFSNGSTVLGTVNLSTAVNGVVSFTTSSTVYTNWSFTAAYSGDGLFEPSTVTITQQPDFVVVAPTTTLGVPQGGQALESITVSPINGYTGTLTATCSNLPVNALCRFQPSPLTLSATASSTLTVQVFAGVNPAVASVGTKAFAGRVGAMVSVVLLMPLAMMLRRRRAAACLMAMALLTVLPMMTGCGSNKTPANSPYGYSTPVGTYSITVTVTDTNSVARTTTFSMNVPTQ